MSSTWHESRAKVRESTHLVLALVLRCELLEELDDDASAGAVVHVDRGRSHPSLQVVHGQRDVLSVHLRTNITSLNTVWIQNTRFKTNILYVTLIR